MKKIIILFFFFSNLFLFSQFLLSLLTIFTDNPTWVGADCVFNVESNILKLAANVNGTYCLANPSKVSVEAQWEFKINFIHLPNNTNFISVYLMSDMSNFENATKGYYLRFGHSSTSGTNEVKLHKIGQ